MLLSIKVELIPNNKQITALKKASGVARHAYNWANTIFNDTLRSPSTDKSLKLPSSIDLHKRLVAEVKTVNPWYYQTNKNVPQQAIKDLRTAWDRFFKKLAQQPKFKKKGKHDSFYLESGSKAKPMIKSDGKRVKLPSIGWVRLTEELPVMATHNCVISRTADKWFIAIKYEVEKPVVGANRPSVGVDIGIKELAVCSNGKVFKNPKAYRRMSLAVKHLQRRLSKKKLGSNNRKKALT
ncbi:MAG: transposase, partial [Rivularia sp. ALOHA_DT_140]|nr:transposase [Rivularia sp. ALOHA_DT_140]